MKKTTTMSAKNKKFHALTKEEKRVAIAKDVIKWIAEDKLIPKKGTYVGLPSSLSKDIHEDTPLDKVFEKEQCKACALGACFIAMVDLGNNIKIGEYFERDFFCNSYADEKIKEDDMKSRLKRIFTPTQVNLIECAFEWENIDDWGVISRIQRKAITFGKKYNMSKDRLIAIMKNIIKNKGTFKP